MKTLYSHTAGGKPYERMTSNILFKCTPTMKTRITKLWGNSERDLSRNIRQILNAEADKTENKQTPL